MGQPLSLKKIGLAKVDPLIGVTIRSALVTAGLFFAHFSIGQGQGVDRIGWEEYFSFRCKRA